MSRIDAFRRYFSPLIWDRGALYHTEERVRTLELHASGMWHAHVLAQQQKAYDVALAFNEGEIHFMACTCTYSKRKLPCKHMAAALMAIDAMLESEEIEVVSTKAAELERVLMNVQHERLVGFVAEAAREDKEFALRVWSEFVDEMSSIIMLQN